MKFEHLTWDSDFFNKKIGKISINSASEFDAATSFLQEKKGENYDLIYVFSDVELPNYKSNLIDKKTTYFWQGEKEAIQDQFVIDLLQNQEKIIPYQEKVIDLGIQSGEYSRFNVDKKFPEGSMEKLYRVWIEKSLSGAIANHLFVFEQEDDVFGVVTLKNTPEVAVIGLIAVDFGARGKAIGSKLMEVTKKIAQQTGHDRVEVTTQLDNVLACRFYEKNDFSIKKIEYIYHFWL